ncbi:MAG: CRISPR-associated endonuclease Cas2 [Ignavibacteriaceae bacterium]|nr:CRISPR-associated endonuclease Cas2 [Ignavibacteriaceae bacterium]
MKYIISYDISSDRIRSKAAKVLEQYGIRIQYSMFECSLTKKELVELKQKLEKLINHKDSSIYFFPLCDSCYNKVIFIGAEYLIKRLSFIDVE